MKQHEFQFTLSTNIGANKPAIPDGIVLNVTSPTETIPFISLSEGRYKAATPFAGVPGDAYEICFTYQAEEYCATTHMPYPIAIDTVMFDSLNNGSPDTPTIHLKLSNTTPNQYLKFKLYKADTTALPLDTIWTETVTPIYEIIQLPVATDTVFTLPINFNWGYLVGANDLVKIETILLSQDIGVFLEETADYVNSQLANGQYYNPPYFFENGAYGLVYGTQIDSAIHRY